MRTLIKKLKRFRRKKRHLRFLQNRIWALKYEILNDALTLEINENKIKLEKLIDLKLDLENKNKDLYNQIINLNSELKI